MLSFICRNGCRFHYQFLLTSVLFFKIRNEDWDGLTWFSQVTQLLDQQWVVKVLFLCYKLHIVSDTCEIGWNPVAEHSACLNLVILLTDIEAVYWCQLDFISFNFTDSVDDSGWIDLAEEFEMQLLKLHQLLSSLTICSILQCRHQVLFNEWLDLVILLAKHSVEVDILFFSVTI